VPSGTMVQGGPWLARWSHQGFRGAETCWAQTWALDPGSEERGTHRGLDNGFCPGTGDSSLLLGGQS
jgi:hypothetical protein